MKNLLIFLLFVSTSSYALVDYSEPVSTPADTFKPKKRARVNKIQAPAPKIGASKSYTPTGLFNFAVGYESLDVKTPKTSGKANFFNIEGHFQTRYNFFIDFSYWTANTSDAEVSEGTSSQNGNPYVVLGFNWLQMGNAADAATIDFYAGVSSKGSSEFAHTRNDKIIGLQTTKRFHELALELGYELRLTGTPGREEDFSIGNINKFSATIGWMVSSDIQFALEGSSYKVGSDSDLARKNRLSQDTTFSSLSPQLGLALSPMIQLVMGGNFRVDRADNQDDLLKAKLWDLEGVYGNSLFVKLNASL